MRMNMHIRAYVCMSVSLREEGDKVCVYLCVLYDFVKDA